MIYKATNPKGQVYIGSTKRDMNVRRIEHKYRSKTFKGLLYDSIRKYGFDNHLFEAVSSDNCLELEHFIIEFFKTELNEVSSYNRTALNKIWVNDGLKEFQVYPDNFKPEYIKGRLFDVAALGRSNKGRKRNIN